MVSLLHNVAIGKGAPEIINIVIEIPMGSRNKYEVDHETGILYLDRVIYSPFHYPTDYGFIPQTWCEDGDPLDAMVLSHNPVVPLCIVKARPIGLFKMRDERGVDEKVLCAPCDDPRFSKVKNINDLPEHLLKEIAHFFEHYKELEKGKFSEVIGWFGSKEAKECIKNAMKLYKEKFRR